MLPQPSVPFTPEQCDQFLQDWNPYHSDYQMLYFVVQKNGITPWGMYQQALRELFRVRNAIQPVPWWKRWRVRVTPEDRRRQECAEREYQTYARIVDTLHKYLVQHHGELTEKVKAALEQDHQIQVAKRQVAIDHLRFGQVTGETVAHIMSMHITCRTLLIEYAREVGAREDLVRHELSRMELLS